ncbi:ABC transporter substrate-binding protein, partial [Bordetella hinzii]|nr:ABC transporter substrate-binding protein [Bordetella hinzii]
MNAVRTALAAALLAATAPALAGTVTVITSFPKDLTQVYKTAFEKAHPGITLEILNKNTVSGIAFVRETPAGQRPEVFWARAPGGVWGAGPGHQPGPGPPVFLKSRAGQKGREPNNPPARGVI